jgi:hypothetical protein
MPALVFIAAGRHQQKGGEDKPPTPEASSIAAACRPETPAHHPSISRGIAAKRSGGTEV